MSGTVAPPLSYLAEGTITVGMDSSGPQVIIVFTIFCVDSCSAHKPNGQKIVNDYIVSYAGATQNWRGGVFTATC